MGRGKYGDYPSYIWDRPSDVDFNALKNVFPNQNSSLIIPDRFTGDNKPFLFFKDGTHNGK